MRELLSNNSLFVGQLYEDKSLVLRACDLIFFTTDLQTELLLNNSLLELIYFLSITDSWYLDIFTSETRYLDQNYKHNW